MRLSFQTVCIVFGVTLVHLFIITALSPVEGGGASETFDIPAMTITDLPAEEIAEPMDLPALPRESAPPIDPVARPRS